MQKYYIKMVFFNRFKHFFSIVTTIRTTRDARNGFRRIFRISLQIFRLEVVVVVEVQSRPLQQMVNRLPKMVTTK